MNVFSDQRPPLVLPDIIQSSLSITSSPLKPLCLFPSSSSSSSSKFLLLGHSSSTSLSLRFQSRCYILPRRIDDVVNVRRLRIKSCKASSAVDGDSSTESARQLFESLKEAEREQVNRLEKFERKANVQLERQLMMASEWSRALLAMRGKLKGTEWDSVNSHSINYSDFKRLLDSNNVQFMEYYNYGQTVSG
ncbi:hypothetical protein BUALT_Bualt04G0054800 [Buddleja alternifolia]|uniref:Uncharacterized protein n=1 Tax=Buddleja alternifolia TaxID=168488 RepID=A0AAV6XT20_9LAMI|nr:hypothetical protein BUALT_Bualt04G0054800 [Buddleja alternifolia]